MRLEQSAIPPEQAIAILRAGPAAEAAFGVLLIAVALLPQPRPLRILFAFYGITALASAWASLHARRYPNSDGSQIRRIRENDQRPAPSVPDHAVDDRDARTSVAPPGY